MKYISFIISCGGDTGWRFTNGEEWNSMHYQLLFDAKLWTMKQIKEALDMLDREIFKKVTWTLSETMDKGKEILEPFVNSTKGVYVKKDFNDNFDGWSTKRTLWFAKKSKVIDPSAEEVVSWELNGKKRNYKNL